MARERSPVVKMSRREGYALHPKAHKVMVRRPQKPGQHGDNVRTKPSQYSLQLREKQKVKRLYGLLERQFAKIMNEATKHKGQSGTVMLEFLERRLDNAIYRAGFAPSRTAARQLVSHGHFALNGKKVNVPSTRLNVGDKVQIKESSKKNNYFKQIDQVSPVPSTKPAWLKVNRSSFSIEVVGSPTREDAEPDINEPLIVEYYSR